jgi:protein ImuB
MKAVADDLFAALRLPRFQLQALRYEGARALPLAMLDVASSLPAESSHDLESAMVLVVNEVAEKVGVRAGMTASQALARCAGLTILKRSLEAETSVQKDLLEHACAWSAEHESTRPGLCVVDLTRARPLQPSLHAAADKMRALFQRLQLDLRIGFARNADLACLAAHAADAVLDLREAEQERQLLERLPLSVLGPRPELAEVLHLWGVQSLGALAKLRRADVADRLGAEGMALWDLAKGGSARLLRLVRPVELYSEEMELEHPVENLEPLLFLLQRMLETLCLRLAEQWLVATAQDLRLRFEDGATHERRLHVAEPTRDAGALLRVLQTHLDGLQAPSPVIAVRLELTPTRPPSQQGSLFDRSLRDPHRFAETLSRLEALLGRGKVGRVHLLPSRRPDSFRLLPALEDLPADEAMAVPESLVRGLPLSRFRPPRPVNVGLQEGHPSWVQMHGRRVGITAWRGPWLLSGDWWDPAAAWEREVWEVQMADRSLYQLAKERSGWVLDGVFS